jgi:hypothetical protein
VRQLSKHEIQKAAMLKAARQAIRLKHSLEADAEIYERLPELERRIEAALLTGRPLEFTVAELLRAEEG